MPELSDDDQDHVTGHARYNSPSSDSSRQTSIKTTKIDVEVQTVGSEYKNIQYILIPIVVAVLAVLMYTLYTTKSSLDRLNEYDRKFEEINKNVAYLDILKQLKDYVPRLQDDISSLEVRAKTIQSNITDLGGKIDPLQKDLENTEFALKSAFKNLHTVEALTKEIRNSNKQVKLELEGEKNKILTLNEKVRGLDSISERISELQKQAQDAEHTLLPLLKRQTRLVNDIQKFEFKAKDLNRSVVYSMTKMSDLEKQMEENKENFEKVDEAVKQAQTINSTIADIKQNITEANSSLNSFKIIVGEVQLNVTTLSHEVIICKSNVSSSMEKQHKIEGQQQMIDNEISKADGSLKNLVQDLSEAKVNIETFNKTVSHAEKNVLERFISIQEDVSVVEHNMTTLRATYNNSIENVTARIEKEERFTDYVQKNLPELVATVQSLDKKVFMPWISVTDILEIAAALLIFVFWFTTRHEAGSLQSENDSSSERVLSRSYNSQSILEQIHRVPVLDSKICILSFYKETQPLHRTLVLSALEACRRGKTLELDVHLVRTHADIPNIPKARYIFIFVDFNERNIILENPDQDLGDKKLVSVLAAQKLGADVFVTYVRDKGSSSLFPGNLYNNDLSAFTRHRTLKKLESEQRCFSVYEQFNTTQKEHIAKIIG